MLAVLVVQDVINLSFLTQLPDEHNFPTSPKAAAFIGQTISFISKLTSPESAAAMYKASGESRLPAPPSVSVKTPLPSPLSPNL